MKGNCGECERRWACEIDPNECNEWPDLAPMTHAQKIRSMSDEELAKFLSQVGYDHRWGLKEYALDWLQQPAEEDKHENLD